MHVAPNTSDRLLLSTETEIFNRIVPANHAFRKLNTIIDFDTLTAPLSKLYSTVGTPSISVVKGIKALIVQFWEDYSDRQMEQALRENMAVRFFCGFSLQEDTPDHSYFGKLRKRIGTKSTADLFKNINNIMESHGLIGNVFTFIDASTIITKGALWDERDRALADGAEKLNNTNVAQYAHDDEARFGAKSKSKKWFGYKRHNAVDMRHGLIVKVAVTPANVPDQKALYRILPDQGTVFADKIYDTKDTRLELQARGIHASIIKKNNNKTKDHNLDSFLSKLRMPFESTFSKQSKRARYVGTTKNVMQGFMQALAYNLKKAVRLIDIPILATS